MPFAFISGLSANYGGGGATDTAITGGPIDTTGANLIVVEVSYFDASSAVTVTDNKGNTYTALTGYGGAGADYRVKLFYCYAPTVGTGHTFVGGVAGAYCSVSIAAFSGAAASPADQSAGSFNSSSSTAQAGSITPTESGELIIATMCNRLDAGSVSINDGFTIVDQELWQSGGLGTALAYKIQTAAAATNPTWTLTSAVKNAPAIYSFKAADGGSGGTPSLVVSDGTHAHAADNLALTIIGTLSIADSSHSHAADSITLTATTNGTITIPAVRDWGTKALKTGQTGVQVDIRNIATGALVVRKTGQTTHATTGVCVVTDAAIVAGTTYEVVTRFADGSRGMWDYTAS